MAWKSAETASSGTMAGALLENWVVIEIIESYLHRGREAPVWYYRDKEKRTGCRATSPRVSSIATSLDASPRGL